MRRFFIDYGCAVGETIVMTESESRHIGRVLRLAPGTMVELLDGSGLVYSAELVEVGRQVLARVDAVRSEQEHKAVSVAIGQGQLKGQKMDVVVQKCTELGIDRFMPFWSSRCQGKLQELQGAKKLERYQRIVESACKQCYRPDLMRVDSSLGVGERSFSRIDTGQNAETGEQNLPTTSSCAAVLFNHARRRRGRGRQQSHSFGPKVGGVCLQRLGIPSLRHRSAFG